MKTAIAIRTVMALAPIAIACGEQPTLGPGGWEPEKKAEEPIPEPTPTGSSTGGIGDGMPWPRTLATDALDPKAGFVPGSPLTGSIVRLQS